MTVTGLVPADEQEIKAFMPGVDNAVRFLGIRSECRVLIGCTSGSNSAYIEAVVRCIRSIGAELSILVTEPLKLHQPTPRVLLEAAKGVDYFLQIGVGPGPHTKDYYILTMDYGVSVAFVAADEAELKGELGTYPFEVWFELHNRLKWKISKYEVDPGVTAKFHLTDDRGSNLTWSVRCPGDIGAWIGADPLNAGWWGAASRPRVLVRAGFGAFILTMGDLQYTTNGVLHVDATNYFGETPEPFKLTFTDGRCTQIEGGELGQRTWDIIGDYRNADRVRELVVAIHPKSSRKMPKYDPDAPVPLAALPRFSHGDFWICLGGDTGVGGVDPGYEHATALFVMTQNATITVDDERILDRGKLLILDDPELRATAAQYGDPDYLLSPAT